MMLSMKEIHNSIILRKEVLCEGQGGFDLDYSDNLVSCVKQISSPFRTSTIIPMGVLLLSTTGRAGFINVAYI